MKQLLFFVTASFFLFMTGCKLNKSSPISVSASDNASEWIANSKWTQELSMKPDQSINQELFVSQIKNNEKAWQTAFEFLKRDDLNSLAIGKYDLSEDGTYATVSEYETKEPETAKYEAHRKYIDIQYVSIGEEYIELLPMDQITENQKYDEQADIVFFDGKPGQQLYANEKFYFVFFPDDVHKPCLKVKESALVRKIVIKIPWQD